MTRTQTDRTQRTDDPWGDRTPYGSGEPWPSRTDGRADRRRLAPEDLRQGVRSRHRLTAPLVRDADGVLIESGGDTAMERIVDGNPVSGQPLFTTSAAARRRAGVT